MAQGVPIMPAIIAESESNENAPSAPEYQVYIDMPDWKDVPAPPTYEDAVIYGISDTPGYEASETVYSQVQQSPQASSLGYVDFLPRLIRQAHPEPVYEEFKVLMTLANNWLQNFPQYCVIRCESIERRIKKTGIIESESTIQMTPAWGVNAFVVGLRLWLTWKTSNGPPQQIWYVNVLPKPIATTIYYGNAMGGRRGFGMSSYAMTMNKTTIYPDFEDLDQTLNHLNAKLREKPVPGQILNIECNDLKYCNNFWDPQIFNPNKHPYNPDKCYYGEVKDKGILYLTCIRLFFVQGPPQPAEIGLEDFTPACMSYISLGRPIFQKLSEVLANANMWIAYNKNIKITNVGTLKTKLSKDIRGDDIGAFKTNSRCTFYSAGNSEVTYIDFIRVAYVKPGNHDYIGLSIKSFKPIRYPNRPSETLAEMLHRMNTWLAVTGAKVKCADTMEYIFNSGVRRTIDTEKTSTVVQPHTGYDWITVIQLYIHGGYVEPPPEILPPAPDIVVDDSSSGSCTLL